MNTRPVGFRILAAMAIAAIAAPVADAHVTVEPKTAARGPVKVVFGVPHGCAGSSTTALRVTIPEGIIGVKPMPKPGWTVNTRRSSYARAYDYFHGSKLGEGVVEVEWSGGLLKDEHFDEFTLIGFISDAFSGDEEIHFPATQICEAGSTNWTEIPKPGTNSHGLKTPAPGIKLRNNGGKRP